MTTDLDERITRALGARADGLTVTRPPLDDALAGPAAVRARPSGPRRALLAAAVVLVVLGIAAAVVATRPDDDGGRVDLSPAEGNTTTTTIPELALSYVPEDMAAEPHEATSPDGLATVLTYGSGDRTLEVTVARATRSSDLEEALDARDTDAVVAAYAAGGSVLAAAAVPATPVAAEVLGAPATTAVGRGPVMLHAQTGDDPLLVLVGRMPAHGEPIDVALVAFRAEAEVRLAGRGVALDEALAVLRGIGGGALAPRARPEADPITAAPLPEGTTFRRAAVTDLPEDWAMTTGTDVGASVATESVGGPPTGAQEASSSYGPPGERPDPNAAFGPTRELFVNVGHDRPLPEEAAALASGDDAAIAEAFQLSTAIPWATGGDRRVVDVDGLVVVVAEGTIDPTTSQMTPGRRELLWANAFLGPDVTVQVGAVGMTEDQLVAAIRSIVLIR
jgi:hypothetical protein